MDKKLFDKTTKKVLEDYGFKKKNNMYVLELNDVTIVIKFRSWRGIKSFDYYFFINSLYDLDVEFKAKYDCVVEYHLEHTPNAQGYHKHEICFEQYTEDEYKDLLSTALSVHFDGFKADALNYLRKTIIYRNCLVEKARVFLGLNWFLLNSYVKKGDLFAKLVITVINKDHEIIYQKMKDIQEEQ